MTNEKAAYSFVIYHSSFVISLLFHRPRLMPRDQFLQVSIAMGLDGFGDLSADQVAIAGLLDGSENAQRFGEIGLAHAAEEKRQSWVGILFVVDEQVVGTDGFQVDDFRRDPVQADAFIQIFSED